MTEQYYGIAGYLDHDPDDDFSFLVPLFVKDGVYYRYSADCHTGLINGFLEYKGKPTTKQIALRPYNAAVGMSAIYLVRFKEKIYYGGKAEISAQLLSLLKRNEVGVFDQYNITAFTGIVTRIAASVSGILAAFPDMGLRQDNFYVPKTRVAHLASLRASLVLYAMMLSRSAYSSLPFEDLFPAAASDDHIRFNDLLIPLVELHGWQEELLNHSGGQQPYYRDLVNYLLAIGSAAEPSAGVVADFPVQVLVSTRVAGGRNFARLYSRMAAGNQVLLGESFDAAWGLESDIEQGEVAALRDGKDEVGDDAQENDRINQFRERLTRELA